MKTLHKLAAATLVAGLFPLIAGTAEAATFIQVLDPLTDTQQAAIVPPFVDTPTSSANITTEVFGSVTRTITIEQQSASQTGDSLVASIPRGGQPGLSFSSGDVTDGKVTVDYGSFASVDFTLDGLSDNEVGISLISSDLAGAVITVTINNSSAQITIPTESATPPPSFLSIPFSAFNNLDPTNVTSFSVMLDPVTAGDLSIEYITLSGSTPPPPPPGTPEPTTMLGLMAVAGFGVSALKRKQR